MIFFFNLKLQTSVLFSYKFHLVTYTLPPVNNKPNIYNKVVICCIHSIFLYTITVQKTQNCDANVLSVFNRKTTRNTFKICLWQYSPYIWTEFSKSFLKIYGKGSQFYTKHKMNTGKFSIKTFFNSSALPCLQRYVVVK